MKLMNKFTIAFNGRRQSMDPPDSLHQMDGPVVQQLFAPTKETKEIGMDLKQKQKPIMEAREENDLECMLTPEQVCRILNIGETTLRRLREEKKLVPKKIRSLPRYRPCDVRTYLAAN